MQEFPELTPAWLDESIRQIAILDVPTSVKKFAANLLQGIEVDHIPAPEIFQAYPYNIAIRWFNQIHGRSLDISVKMNGRYSFLCWTGNTHSNIQHVNRGVFRGVASHNFEVIRDAVSWCFPGCFQGQEQAC